MNYFFVIWLGEKPMEKIFTSLRILLWLNILNKLFNQSKNSFLFMFDIDLMEWINRLNLLKDEELNFLQISSADQQERFENLLKNSKLISYDNENRLMVNIEEIDNDYLLKSTKDLSSR